MPRKHPKTPPKIVAPQGVRVPGYRRHKASGQGIVTLSGKDFYLRPHGSPESYERYRELAGRWLAQGRRPLGQPEGAPRTVAEVLLAFVEDAEVRFSGRRGEKQLIHRVKTAVRGVRMLYGTTPAGEFGPRALLAVRRTWVEHGYCRTVVNDLVKVVRQAWKYAARHELISASSWHALLTVDPLKRGESTAQEPRKIKPVPEQFINAALPFMRPQVAAMVQLQLFTGARPGEITIMRTCDIDAGGPVWVYTPRYHKAEGRHERTILIGPGAQEVLRPWLRTELEAHLFQPREAEADRDDERRRQRKTPRWPSHVRAQAKRRKRAPLRAPEEVYSVQSYRQAIHRACDAADREARGEAGQPACEECGGRVPEGASRPKPCAECEGSGFAGERLISKWSPHALRHNFASRVRAEAGAELTRVLLGHAIGTLSVTERYAEVDSKGAKAIIAKIG